MSEPWYSFSLTEIAGKNATPHRQCDHDTRCGTLRRVNDRTMRCEVCGRLFAIGFLAMKQMGGA